MKGVERSDGCGLEQCGARADGLADFDDADLRHDLPGFAGQVGCDASHGTHDLHFHDRAGDLVRITDEELAQRSALGLLDDELD
jgi:hypothetical protein